MELELKFALTANASELPGLLARVPLIGRRHPQRQPMHNTYYDTPAHVLQRQHVALRVRRVGGEVRPHWLQTLKIGGAADSALSQRGEWEDALPGSALSAALLADTPWQDLDPQGALFAALQPVFSTRFERLRWIVTLGDAQVEVALDRGSVQVNGLSTPLCELEIELQSGPPEALFEVAEHISQQLCLLPLHLSKAERAYRLASGTLHAPLHASPPPLTQSMPLAQAARSVLREAFLQFTANLYGLLESDAPELLHQCRVGWRRFKTALRFFRQRGPESGLPDLSALQALLDCMTALRDLEVCRSEVLPAYASAYQGEDAGRIRQWLQLQAALAREARQQHALLRHLMSEVAVGQTLLQVTRWLECHSLGLPQRRRARKPISLQRWARKRIKQWAAKLDQAPPQSADAQAQHRLRIRSKRLRYSVESLRSLLPARRAKRWQRRALRLQTALGQARDLQQAIAIAERLRAEPVAAFLRGTLFAH